MKKSFIVFSLLMVMVLAGGAFAAETGTPPAGPGPGQPGASPGHGKSPGAGSQLLWWENPQLNLSAEQKTKIEALFQAFQKEIIPLRSSWLEKRQELEALLAQAQLDKAKILAKHKEITTTQNTMEEKRLNLQIAQFELLTPEQRTLVGSMKPYSRTPHGAR